MDWRSSRQTPDKTPVFRRAIVVADGVCSRLRRLTIISLAAALQELDEPVHLRHAKAQHHHQNAETNHCEVEVQCRLPLLVAGLNFTKDREEMQDFLRFSEICFLGRLKVVQFVNYALRSMRWRPFRCVGLC